MKRRHFCQSTFAAALLSTARAAAGDRAPRLLLRSSWQVVNIGDIAHTPGVLALLEKHLPHAEVMLWASGDLSEEVMAMEHRRFPNLKIVKGSINADGKASNSGLEAAVAWSDFLLHGSGPSLVAAKDVAAYLKHTAKPFGVYGITHGSFLSGNDKELLSRAKFVFFRDTPSLDRARSEGAASPIMEFGPDGAFACDLRNDEAADTFLKAHALEHGKFVCCIPRLRYSPYWLMVPGRAKDEKRAARNAEMADRDHAPLREAIIALVRQTDLKVLVCPEDKSHMAVGREWIMDRLPDDVKPRVVWRETFWLTDEALSTYRKSAGLFGLEMHSPIMCIGNGIPAIVGRFQEQTTKGLMWRDIGLGDWLFDFDNEVEKAAFVPAVLAMVRDPAASKAKAAAARAVVEKRQAETMAVVGRHLKVPP